MDTDDGTDITWETATTDSRREIFFGVLFPKVDDKVTIEAIKFWSFFEEFTLLVLLEKELWEGLFLDLMDLGEIKPFS